jgi:hypothetical protein
MLREEAGWGNQEQEAIGGTQEGEEISCCKSSHGRLEVWVPWKDRVHVLKRNQMAWRSPSQKTYWRDLCSYDEPCWFSEPPLKAVVTLLLVVPWFLSALDWPVSGLIFLYVLCSACHLLLANFLLGFLLDLQDEVVCSSKTLGFLQTTRTWHYIPEERTLIVQMVWLSAKCHN